MNHFESDSSFSCIQQPSCYIIANMTGEPNNHKSVAQIMGTLLIENPNQPDIKRQINDFTKIIQKHTYHALISNEQQYLHVYGLTYHQEEHFNFINHLLHSRTTQFLDSIAENCVQIKSTKPPLPPPPPQVSEQIMQQVEDVLNNVDLPLSLFKRNDNYWSHDNPKTVQVKEYIKELHEQDRRWKNDLKKKRHEILNEKNEKYHQTIEEQKKEEQKAKEEEKTRMIKKIEQIKSQAENRKRTIEESLDFMKKQGRPLFKKMEEEFYNKIELPTLEEKKRKLTQVRQLRRSVDLVEINQHRQKYDKIKEEHEQVKITSQPVKVSFKSQFYKSMERSRVGDLSDSRAKSLYEKRVEYAQIIKQNFKPKIDDEKVNQIAERVELMNKRFTRAKKVKKELKNEDDDQEEQEEQEEPEPEPQPEPEQQDEDDEQDEQMRIKNPKDDQYQPTHDQRYKMGLKFLEEAKNKRKRMTKNNTQSEQIKNSTFTVDQAKNAAAVIHQALLPASNQANRKIKYRNYLHQMSKTNKTIDFIDTSQIKRDTNDMKLKNKYKMDELENKIRSVEEKAKNQEELLKYKKVKRTEAIGKKLELDNAIIDTIKARLAMMNH